MKFRLPNYFVAVFCLGVIAGGPACQLPAQQEFEYRPVAPNNLLVPQSVMQLVHAAEVQKEIGISSSNAKQFEDGLRELDKVWWPARILPLEEQRTTIAKLEAQLSALVLKIAGKRGLERLHQLELQAQAIRILARPDVQKRLRMNPEQISTCKEIFQATDKLASSISPTKPDPKKQKELQAAKEQEAKRCLAEALQREQIEILPSLFGATFATESLSRIYPLAPELEWGSTNFGETQPKLKELKGKVTLVHFYAYECHNCHANFEHYKRWQEKLASKGVQVIGIQSPETNNERVAENVIEAAKKREFNFPVLIDLDMANWKGWGNTMWPTVYVIDKKGYIRFWWQGELNYEGATGDKQIEKLVSALLAEE